MLVYMFYFDELFVEVISQTGGAPTTFPAVVIVGGIS